MAENVSDKIVVIDDDKLAGLLNVTPEVLKGIALFQNRKIPKENLKQHPGKGGKTFTYIDHAYLTEQLQIVFQQLWSLETLDYSVFPDGSALARVKLTIKIPRPDGTFFERTIIEVGSFEGNDAMSTANKVASAVSRGLARACMRMFGIGLEFYKTTDVAITPIEAWNQILAYATSKGVERDSLVTALKEAGISKDTLIEKFEEAYKLAYKLATISKQDEIPTEL